ncbi:MAG: hypothetical protein HC899_37925 [Leptolyngbyaceae cyanobacterium SM1_4_3]|nr:hypothetical protein [Leptolyngbyaceae cyanobacterium SM1_4_3]
MTDKLTGDRNNLVRIRGAIAITTVKLLVSERPLVRRQVWDWQQAIPLEKPLEPFVWGWRSG